MKRPPVAVVPYADESIASMIWRLERQTATRVEIPSGTSRRRMIDNPDDSLLEYLSGILGIEAGELARHTLAGRVRDGHRLVPTVHYRVAGQLRCPQCGIQPMWTRLWPVTSCDACGVLLAEEGAVPRQSPDEARDLQTRYLENLQRGGPRGDEQVRRFEHLLHFHLCTSWPAGATSGSLMRTNARIGSSLGAAWRAPSWIAEFARTAWPASATIATFQTHIGRVASRCLLAETANSPDGDSAAQRDALHRELRDWALDRRHLPVFLLTGHSPFDSCHLGAIGTAIARSLNREIVRARSGRDGGSRPEMQRKYRQPLKPEHAAVNHFLSNEAAGIKILRHYARILAASDPADRVDYQERRAILAARHRVPASVVRRMSPIIRDRAATTSSQAADLGRDAAAWIWMELGAGSLRRSPYSAVGWKHLRTFDKQLTPEDRLILLEYANDVLGAVADDVSRHHVAHRAGETGTGLSDVG